MLEPESAPPNVTAEALSAKVSHFCYYESSTTLVLLLIGSQETYNYWNPGYISS